MLRRYPPSATVVLIARRCPFARLVGPLKTPGWSCEHEVSHCNRPRVRRQPPPGRTRWVVFGKT